MKKKVNSNNYNISSIKRVTWKCLEVSRYSNDIVVQNNGIEMYIKSVLQVQSGFFFFFAN